MMCNATISKWGNSLAIRIPQSFSQKLNLQEGEKVSITQQGEELLISKHPILLLSIEEMLQGITYESLTSYNDIDFGVPVGKEIW